MRPFLNFENQMAQIYFERVGIGIALPINKSVKSKELNQFRLVTDLTQAHQVNQATRRGDLVGALGQVKLKKMMELLRKNLRQKCEELEAVPPLTLGPDECLKEHLAKAQGDGIPKFFSKPEPLTPEKQLFRMKLRDEARELLLKEKSESLFDHDELTSLYDTMKQHASPPFTADDSFINYLDFKRMLAGLCPKGKEMLNAKVFMKLLQDDPYGRVSITVLFNYVMRKTWMRQTRIGLCIYDEEGKGYIKAEGLDNYINELIPTLTQLNGMDASVVPFYVCTVARIFFFFLDPSRTGRIKILDILSCGFIDELLDLRETDPPKMSNWFSLDTAMKIYGHYLNLDKDHNGMLSKEEMLQFGKNMTLTQTFVDRVFQVCQTFEGEMDYKCYLDFVLAMDHRNEPQAIQYFFRILDIDQKGYLNAFTLNYFFKDILKYLQQNNAEAEISFSDVKDEIFDMVKPKDPNIITVQDLINCGTGATVIAILTDCQGFWSYENREILIPDMRNVGSGQISSQV